jgi:outer membrane murein-binding lipoprotein Lpp
MKNKNLLWMSLLIIMSILIACEKPNPSKTELQQKQKEHATKMLELNKKGAELDNKIGGTFVNDKLVQMKQNDPGKSDAYYWKGLTQELLGDPGLVQQLKDMGAYDLVVEIEALATEILTLEARIAELQANSKAPAKKNQPYYAKYVTDNAEALK